MQRKLSIVYCLFLLALAACSKDNDTTPEPEQPTSVATGVYRVVNLVADTTASSSGNAVSMYYSLEDNKVIPESQRQTGNWDIVFYGIYNSSVFPNNGAIQGSPGYGGPGKAQIYIQTNPQLDEQYYDNVNFKPKVLPIPQSLFPTAFAAVKTADDTKFVKRDIGLDHFQNSFDGWGYYDFYGALFPTDPKKAHVVYTLPRVMIVKTHKGNYAKVMIENIYKDNPANPDRDNKPGYVTFTYAINKDGSKNLDIKQ